MGLKTTVLFSRPQSEIRSLLTNHLSRSVCTKIVTGFATPGGLNAISDPIVANPGSINTIILGASTYPGFEALDQISAAGVPLSNLYIHLGHTRPSGGRKNPTVRFHPMLHSKIYYMEFPDGSASAFVGSHNMTSFALNGANGEASVLLEGPVSDDQFVDIRDHIDEARYQSIQYSPTMKEALAWWTKEYIEGMRAEVRIPNPDDWRSTRTILIFAEADTAYRPSPGEHIYFEIPEGIEQIVSLSTEVHLYLFATMPPDPSTALNSIDNADAAYKCRVLGVENKQGNLEVSAHWDIDGTRPPILKPVTSGVLRPRSSSGMQQVRAEVIDSMTDSFEHQFESGKLQWDPVYDSQQEIFESLPESTGLDSRVRLSDNQSPQKEWRLVTGLVPRDRERPTKDFLALEEVSPESGSFLLVSLKRRHLTGER